MKKGRLNKIALWSWMCLALWCCKPADKAYPLLETPVQDANFYQLGLAAVERKVKADPNNPDAHFKKALYLEALGQTDEALSAVKQAINLDPTPDYLMKEAELLLSKGDHQRALASISRAQILGGDYPDLWHLMAKLNYLAGNYQDARSDVDNALQKYPKGINYYCIKGQIEWVLHDTIFALSSFLKSVGHPETKYESLKYLTTISKAMGDYQQSFHYLDQNLQSNIDDPDLLIEKGKLFAESQQYDSALIIFRFLRHQDTTDFVPFFESAQVHYYTRRYDSTLFYTDKSLQLHQGHLPSMLMQARVYDRRRYYGTALKKYHEILAIDSTYVPAVEELAKLKRKIAYLQKIQRDREENAQVETISPTRPPIRN